jgi:hypothetical protein
MYGASAQYSVAIFVGNKAISLNIKPALQNGEIAAEKTLMLAIKAAEAGKIDSGTLK